MSGQTGNLVSTWGLNCWMTGQGRIEPQPACGIEATVTVTAAFIAPYKSAFTLQYIVVRQKPCLCTTHPGSGCAFSPPTTNSIGACVRNHAVVALLHSATHSTTGYIAQRPLAHRITQISPSYYNSKTASKLTIINSNTHTHETNKKGAFYAHILSK